MATEEYIIDYKATDSATAITKALAAAVAQLDALVEKCKKDLNGFAAGGAKSAADAKKQVDTLNASLNGLADQTGKVKAGMDGAATGTDSFGSSMLKMRAATLVMHEVVAIFQAIGDGLHRAQEKSEELARSNLKLRDSMRELANLQGHEGPDDEVAGNAILLGMASGMDPKESEKFLSQFEGSIPAGRQKGNLGAAGAGRDKLEKAMAREGAAFSARIGLDAATGGDVAGSISMYSKIDKVEDMAGQLGAMAYGLNEGRGRITTLMRSELGAAAQAVGTGRVKDLAELGAFVGVGSTVSKTASAAGTKYSQLDSFLNRQGGPSGDYLDSIGASRAGTDYEKLDIVRKDLQKNAGTDWDRYLAQKGFGSKQERAAAVGFASNFDVLTQRIANSRKIADTGGATVMAENRAFLGRTITGQARQADAAKAAAEFLQGKGGESVMVAQISAEARLRARGEIDTRETERQDAIIDQTTNKIPRNLGGVDSRRMRINKEMLAALNTEAARVGVSPISDRVGLRLNRQNEVEAAFRSKSAEILAKDPNANVTGGSGEIVAKLQALIDIENAKQAQRNGPQPPPPPAGKGGVVPRRP